MYLREGDNENRREPFYCKELGKVYSFGLWLSTAVAYMQKRKCVGLSLASNFYRTKNFHLLFEA